MRQQRASRDYSTHTYENAAYSKRMIQLRVSRDGETCASENAARAERISQ